MEEVYPVLVETDEENRIHYTEDAAFISGSEEAQSAFREYTSLVMISRILGYKIIKREKEAIDSMDEQTDDFSDRSR